MVRLDPPSAGQSRPVCSPVSQSSYSSSLKSRRIADLVSAGSSDSVISGISRAWRLFWIQEGLLVPECLVSVLPCNTIFVFFSLLFSSLLFSLSVSLCLSVFAIKCKKGRCLAAGHVTPTLTAFSPFLPSFSGRSSASFLLLLFFHSVCCQSSSSLVLPPSNLSPILPVSRAPSYPVPSVPKLPPTTFNQVNYKGSLQVLPESYIQLWFNRIISSAIKMSSAVENVANPANEAPVDQQQQQQQASDAAAASADEGRRLYIGNLAYATTEGELKEFFKNYTM